MTGRGEKVCGPVSPVSPRSDTQIESASAALWDSPGGVVLTAFVLRLLVIVVGHTYRITPRRDHFQFGWEMGRLARSVATGHGFSSPTDLDTGPSAWAPPVYPYMLAAVFRLFGIYSAASAFVILTINSLFAALTSINVYGIAKRIYGIGIARWAAWTWALFPYVIYWPVRVVWETSLTTFLLSLAFLLALRMGDKSPRLGSWITFGALWGLVMLTNTAAVSMFPFCLLWILYRSRPASIHVPKAALSCFVALAVVSPWIVRNYEVFDKFIFVRDNLPLELHMANNQQSAGLWTRNEHPANDFAAMHEFQRSGEAAFMQQKRNQFQSFLRAHPALFVWFTVKRSFYFWAAPPSLSLTSNGYDLGFARHIGFLLGAVLAFAGLYITIRRGHRGAFLMACLLFVYPLPYYLVNPFPRYKAPIEPEMIVLIVYLLAEAGRVQLRVRK